MATDPIRLAGGPTERAAGEQVAELFEQHGRMVYGLCRVLLRDPVEADDATQASFVSAFKALLGGGEVREPAAWLATIARNECRARSHARMREPLPLLEDDVAHAHGPHEEVNRRIAVQEIREAIAELPDKQREAVVLRDLYGMRYDEVGAALGLSRASVEALLFRGRRRLRVRLKPLASGALAVPLAVREGIAQALPGFGASASGTGALAGGVTAAAGGGLIAKIAAAPVAAKFAAAAVAVGAAGSAGVVGAERVTHDDGRKAQVQPLTAQAAAPVAVAPEPREARLVPVASSRPPAGRAHGTKDSASAGPSNPSENRGRDDDRTGESVAREREQPEAEQSVEGGRDDGEGEKQAAGATREGGSSGPATEARRRERRDDAAPQRTAGGGVREESRAGDQQPEHDGGSATSGPSVDEHVDEHEDGGSGSSSESDTHAETQPAETEPTETEPHS